MSAASDLAQAQGRFVTGEGLVYGPNGRPFLARGANVGSTGSFNWKGAGDGQSQRALDWGWNMARFNILATDASSISYRRLLSKTQTQFIDYLDTLVAEWTGKGIVVMFAAHDKPKEYPAPNDQATVEGKLASFWAEAAARWAGNPLVWFNPINEPSYVDDAWVTLHDTLCSAIRGAGASAPIVIDTPGASQDCASLYVPGAKYAYDATMGPVLLATHGNLLMSNHNYGAKWNTDALTAQWIANTRAAGLTPFFGEYGWTIDGSTTAGSYTANLNAGLATIKAAQLYGVGALAWHATHGDNYSTKANGAAFYYGGASFNLSPFGQSIRSISGPGGSARFGGTARR